MSRIWIFVCLAVFAAGLLVGCNHHRKPHNARMSGGGGTNAAVVATSSVSKVSPSGTFTLSASLTGYTGTVSYVWSDTSVNPISSFTAGATGQTVPVAVPSGGPAVLMDFQVEVFSSSGVLLARNFTSVLFDGVKQHLIDFTPVNNAPGTTDHVTARFYRADGTDVDGGKQIFLEFTVANGTTHTVQSAKMSLILQAILEFQSDTTLVDSGGQAVELSGAVLTATVIERVGAVNVVLATNVPLSITTPTLGVALP